MLNKTLTHLMCGVALAVAGGFVASQAASAQGDKNKMDDMMMQADTNHDGMISAEEHAAYAKMMFDKADTNHDGMLSRDEIMAMHKSMHGQMKHHDCMGHDDKTGNAAEPGKMPVKK